MGKTGLNKDTNRISKLVDKDVYIGIRTIKSGVVIFKALEKNKDDFIKMFKKAEWPNHLTIYKTNNPKSIDLEINRKGTSIDDLEKIVLNDGLNEEYGPFEVVDEIDLDGFIVEETEHEDELEEDDYVRWVKKNIKSVVGVRKVGKDQYVISIS